MKKVVAEINRLEQKLADASLTSYVELEYESTTVVQKKLPLKWSYEIDARSWGIKDITVMVPEQTLNFEIEEDDENGDAVGKDMSLKIERPKIEYERSGEHGLALYPTKIEVYRGKVTVFFHKG